MRWGTQVEDVKHKVENSIGALASLGGSTRVASEPYGNAITNWLKSTPHILRNRYTELSPSQNA